MTVTPTDDAAAPGAAAVVALVLGIVAGPAWFVVTVVAGVVAAWQWFAGEQRGRDQRMQAQQRAEQFDADLAAARRDVAAEADRARTQREAVATVVSDLDEALADVGARTPA
ncbi:hypothetical protein L603_002000000050 [Cellulosimicrobium cellulans J34]|nr:hypothetical protein L603_002000000050 [Cellulosimicrobium cellulans J34]